MVASFVMSIQINQIIICVNFKCDNPIQMQSQLRQWWRRAILGLDGLAVLLAFLEVHYTFKHWPELLKKYPKFMILQILFLDIAFFGS